jgi:hypothetical protein
VPGEDGEASRPGKGRARPGARQVLVAGAHLLVLSAFALAQPLYDLLSRNAEFFAVRGSTRLDIVVFALAILLVPPAAFFVVEALATVAGARVWRFVHLLFVGALSAVIVLEGAKRLVDQSGTWLLVATGFLGAGLAVAYWRLPPVRSFLTVLVPAPLVFILLFLFHSPVSKLVLVHEGHAKSVAFEARTPVVFVVFDEFSTVSLMDARGRIDAKRFPNFAALARDATFYRDATTVHPLTEQAVPAIETGLLPKEGDLPIYADHPQNLFTLLGGGYRMRVQEYLTRLCPPRLCKREDAEPVGQRLDSLASDLSVVYLHILLPDSLATRLPRVDRSWKDFSGNEVGTAEDVAGNGDGPATCEPICSYLKHVSSARPGTLHFIHMLLPHVPYRYLPSGKRYVGDTRVKPGVVDDRLGDDSFLADQAQARYLLQVGFTDRTLGLILARLHETGLYDRALVVVLADHGVSFQPGEPRRKVSSANLHDIAFMPLFVKLPEQRRGRVQPGFVRTIDVLPTVADALGVGIPWHVDGHSLLGRRPPADSLVTIRAYDGRILRVPLSRLLAERAQALRRQVELFGTGGWSSLYGTGPHAELVGRSLADFQVGSAAGMKVKLGGRALLDAVDPDSSVAPVYLDGEIAGGQAEMDLAVAVNGKIVTTTRTYDSDGDARLSALLPEASLVSGRNEVDVFVVRESSTGPVLDKVEPDNPSLSLESGSIRLSEGGTLRIEPGSIHGQIRVSRQGDRISFIGWAADLDRRSRVDSIVVFVDGRSLYLAQGRSFRRRLPLEEEGIGNPGFGFELPPSLLPADRAANVRIFALSGERAAELRYAPEYPWLH